jgi:hypothetical protein
MILLSKKSFIFVTPNRSFDIKFIINLNRKKQIIWQNVLSLFYFAQSIVKNKNIRYYDDLNVIYIYIKNNVNEAADRDTYKYKEQIICLIDKFQRINPYIFLT